MIRSGWALFVVSNCFLSLPPSLSLSFSRSFSLPLPPFLSVFRKRSVWWCEESQMEREGCCCQVLHLGRSQGWIFRRGTFNKINSLTNRYYTTLTIIWNTACLSEPASVSRAHCGDARCLCQWTCKFIKYLPPVLNYNSQRWWWWMMCFSTALHCLGVCTNVPGERWVEVCCACTLSCISLSWKPWDGLK